MRLLVPQEAVNSGDNSHLVVVPAGTILSDNLYNTPLFQGEGFGFGGGGEGEGGQPGGGEVSLPFRNGVKYQGERESVLLVRSGCSWVEGEGPSAQSSCTTLSTCLVSPSTWQSLLATKSDFILALS
jgi:hypothetical protein